MLIERDPHRVGGYGVGAKTRISNYGYGIALAANVGLAQPQFERAVQHGIVFAAEHESDLKLRCLTSREVQSAQLVGPHFQGVWKNPL